MPDREKVIKAAEDYEPYARVFTNLTVKGDLFLDMLTLLKEQETMLVEIDGQLGGIKYGRCPKCGNGLNQEVYPHWCGFCGQGVKWE